MNTVKKFSSEKQSLQANIAKVQEELKARSEIGKPSPGASSSEKKIYKWREMRPSPREANIRNKLTQAIDGLKAKYLEKEEEETIEFNQIAEKRSELQNRWSKYCTSTSQSSSCSEADLADVLEKRFIMYRAIWETSKQDEEAARKKYDNREIEARKVEKSLAKKGTDAYKSRC